MSDDITPKQGQNCSIFPYHLSLNVCQMIKRNGQVFWNFKGSVSQTFPYGNPLWLQKIINTPRNKKIKHKNNVHGTKLRNGKTTEINVAASATVLLNHWYTPILKFYILMYVIWMWTSDQQWLCNSSPKDISDN